MSLTNYLRLHLELRVRNDQRELLDGLDNWLKLGLITPEEVKQLCQNSLTCSLPLRSISVIQETHSETELVAASQPTGKKKQSFWLRISQSFREEFSVRWLLLLGIFLVILSSIVLAASGWQRFSDPVQYLILFLYTLAFWITGIWLNRLSSVPLTALTLQKIAILLIPVNFWAMDTFNLWLDFEGIIVMAIASLTLTIICLLQNRHQQNLSSSLNYLTLSFLHWGWEWQTFPLIAIYLGGVITFFVLQFLSPRRNIEITFIIYAFIVILTRGIFIAQVPLNQLGLVIGIIGWLVAGRRLHIYIKKWAPIIGFTLFLVAFCVTIRESFPWQVIIILCLAIHCNFYYLTKYWQRRYCLAIFFLSLQLFFLWEKIIPEGIKINAVKVWYSLIQPNNFASIYAVTIFIYLAIFLGFTDWIYRKNKAKIALFGERLTLILAFMVFITISFNPVAQLFNLALSTITLAFLAYRRTPTSFFRVNFAHIIGILTILAIVDWQLPNLIYSQWVGIFLAIMVLEWLISAIFVNITLCRNSCWLMGLILAGCSYFILRSRVENPEVGVFWLLTPITLTAIIPRYPLPQRQNIVKISCLALVIAQLLTILSPNTRIIGFAVATVSMFINYRYLPRQNTAILHYGFILALVGSILSFQLGISNWWLPGAIAALLLWLLGPYLGNKYPIYAQSAYLWSKSLSLSFLIVLSFRSFLLTVNLFSPGWQPLGALFIFSICLILWYRRENRSSLIFGLAWLLELILVETILLWGGNNLNLATANVILGLLLITFRPWLSRQNDNLVLLPLFYGTIGFICRLDYFTPYTGLLTLGIAFIGIGVTTVRREWQPLTYLSMLGISLGIYESLLYHLLPFSPEAHLQQLTLIAFVTASIAIAYRLCGWLWRESLFNLSSQEIKTVAHLHWGIATGINVILLLAKETFTEFALLSFLLPLILGIYALIQGRDINRVEKNVWVYVGIIQIIASLIYLHFTWQPMRIIDSFVVILVCFGAIITYFLPWTRWGWSKRPWYRSATIAPIVTILLSNPNYLDLIIVAIFYLLLAKQQDNIRWSYLSLAFLDWAIIRWLLTFNDLDLLWYISLIGLSIIYIATVDPFLQLPQQRKSRHHLRLFGGGIIGLVALWLHQETGLIPASLGLFSIFLGLALKIRAFLFLGTITFTLTVFYQLIILGLKYSFLKWMISLIIGISLISVAANFERSRVQLIVIWQQWITQLEQWE